MLSNASFNALLKTLEEPPAHAIFILATTELHKFPATIVSRCQRFDFRRIDSSLVVERLTKLAEREGVSVEKSVLEAVARRAGGSMRDAESVLGQLFVLGSKIGWDEASMVMPHSNREDALALAELLLSGDARGGLALIHRLRDEGMELGQFTADFVEFMRELLLAKLGAVPPAESVAEMNDLAGRMDSGKLLRWIDRFNRRRYEQKGAEIPELPLELAIVETCTEGQETGDKRQGFGKKPDGQKVPESGSQEVREPVILRAERSVVEKAESSIDEEKKTELSPLSQKNKQKERSPAHPDHDQDAAVAESAVSEAKVEASGASSESASGGQEDAPAAEAKVEAVDSPVEGVVGVEDVRSRWNELIGSVKEENPSLPILLMVAKVVGVVGRTVRVGLEYPFHREKLASIKNRAVVEQALSVIFGKPLSIEVVSVEPEQDKALDAVLNTFGGRVVG